MQRPLGGLKSSAEVGLAKPVDLYFTRAARGAEAVDLLVHFHGASWVAMQSAEATKRPLAVIAVHLGAGSRAYEQPFADRDAFNRLIAAIKIPVRRRYVSSFSAGYGAVRALLRNGEQLDGVLLLDGLHTGYRDGSLEAEKMEPFERYARRAAAGEVRMIVTHSSIKPPDYASTTETADALIRAANATCSRSRECRASRLLIRGFGGDQAADHIDHLHSMPRFLKLLLR